MNKGEQLHIERLDGVSNRESQTDDVTVVWCALKSIENDETEMVIVGWYEHACVYRYYQSSVGSLLD